MQVTCKKCGKLFQATPSRAKQKRIFCSFSCFRNSPARLERRLVSRTCKHCGQVFTIYISKVKRSCGKYCSKNCYKMAIHPGFITCKECGTQSKNFRGKRTKKFCSVHCALKHNLSKRPKKFNFKHGKSIAKKYSHNFKNKNCYFSCNNKNIELHHKDGNPFNNVKSNWMFVCRKCHMRIHKISKRLDISLLQALDFYKTNSLSQLTSQTYRNYWLAFSVGT